MGGLNFGDVICARRYWVITRKMVVRGVERGGAVSGTVHEWEWDYINFVLTNHENKQERYSF